MGYNARSIVRDYREEWVQVRTAGEAIQLLDEFAVQELSIGDIAAGLRVSDWLIEQSEERHRVRWPAAIAVHGPADDDDVGAVAAMIARGGARLQRSAARYWTRS
jgi:hypothetical protein